MTTTPEWLWLLHRLGTYIGPSQNPRGVSLAASRLADYIDAEAASAVYRELYLRPPDIGSDVPGGGAV